MMIEMLVQGSHIALVFFFSVHRIRWLREVGLMNRVHRQFIPSKPRCEAGSRKFVSVGITEIRPAVLFFAIGMLTSFIIMLLEAIYVKVKALRNQIKSKPAQSQEKLLKKNIVK